MRERERDLGRGGGGGEGVGKEMREFLCNFVFEGMIAMKVTTIVWWQWQDNDSGEDG